MKYVIFLTHWSCAFIEEQFYALYRRLRLSNNSSYIYFTDWHNRAAVRHLLSLFEPSATKESISYDSTFYPIATIDSPDHQLAECMHENSLFIVYFNPRHLAFFRKSTGNRFPTRYIWWQIEQASNSAFFQDKAYCDTIAKARGILNVSHFNNLSLSAPVWYAPFSRARQLLQYNECDHARLYLCNHQKARLVQDNPRFATAMPALGDVLLLGSCDVPRRQAFKSLCAARGLTLQHPHAFNYLFGLERQQFIHDFVRGRHSQGKQAVAVNVHQHLPAMLEQAKIYLLLANGCDVVVSERSHNAAEDALLVTACGTRLILVTLLDDVADQAVKYCGEKWQCEVQVLDDSPWQSSHFRRLSQQLLSLV